MAVYQRDFPQLGSLVTSDAPDDFDLETWEALFKYGEEGTGSWKIKASRLFPTDGIKTITSLFERQIYRDFSKEQVKAGKMVHALAQILAAKFEPLPIIKKLVKQTSIPECVNELLLRFIGYEMEGDERTMLTRLSKSSNTWGLATDVIGKLQITPFNDQESMLDLIDRKLDSLREEGITNWGIIDHPSDSTIQINLNFAQIWEKYDLELKIKQDKRYFKKLVDFTTNKETPAASYIPLDRLVEIEEGATCEDWLAFESQMPDWAVGPYRAAIFGIFLPENRSRQILFLLDEGGSGKSYIMSALAQIGGGSKFAASFSRNAITNQFWATAIHRKRLITIPDSGNPLWTQTDAIKQITGGDEVMVEYKGKTPFRYRPNVRIIAASNTLPEIDVTKHNQLSRILVVPIQSKKWESDDSYSERLKAQSWAYLKLCRESYFSLCPHHGDIKMPPEMHAFLQAKCVGDGAFNLQVALNQYLDLGGASAKLAHRETDAILKDMGYSDKPERKKLAKELRQDLLKTYRSISLMGAPSDGTRWLSGVKLRECYTYNGDTDELDFDKRLQVVEAVNEDTEKL